MAPLTLGCFEIWAKSNEGGLPQAGLGVPVGFCQFAPNEIHVVIAISSMPTSSWGCIAWKHLLPTAAPCNRIGVCPATNVWRPTSMRCYGRRMTCVGTKESLKG